MERILVISSTEEVTLNVVEKQDLSTILSTLVPKIQNSDNVYLVQIDGEGLISSIYPDNTVLSGSPEPDSEE